MNRQTSCKQNKKVLHLLLSEYLVTPVVDDGPVQEDPQPCLYPKTGPEGTMQWPSSLLNSRQIHFAVHYIVALPGTGHCLLQ